MTEEKTFKERFDVLNESFNSFKDEGTNLEEAGIKELNTKIGFLVELDNNARNLAKEVKLNNNDADLVSDGEVLGDISEFLKSLEENSSELRDAQRGREKLRNKIIDEKHVLEGQRDEFDFKVNDASEKINQERQILDKELSLVDRNHHESLLEEYEKYIDALNEERVPVDELYNKYNGEIELLLDGGKPNYKLEDGNLVESVASKIPEIKKEDVINNTTMYEEPEHIEELVEEPVTDEEVVSKESEAPVELNIDDIRKEVEDELSEANNEEIEPEKEEPLLDSFGDYLEDKEETTFEQNNEIEPVEEKKDEVDDNPIFQDDFVFEPLNEQNNIKKEISEEIKEPVMEEESSEEIKEPVMEEEPVVEEPVLEDVKKEPEEFDMLTALKNLKVQLDDVDSMKDDFIEGNKMEVTDMEDASINLLKKVTPEVLNNATEYMNQFNKELNVENKDVEAQYQLREDETLSASVIDENGEEKTVEIDADGTKTIKDSKGNVVNTEHIDLDESTLKGENIKVVDTNDINVSNEEPKEPMPYMPDFSSLEEPEEGFSRKMVA